MSAEVPIGFIQCLPQGFGRFPIRLDDGGDEFGRQAVSEDAFYEDAHGLEMGPRGERVTERRLGDPDEFILKLIAVTRRVCNP